MAQIDQAHAAGYTGKGQTIAIIDAWIDYTHPALGGCLGDGCLVSFSHEWLEEDDKNNPDPECKSHSTSLAGVIAAQAGSGPAGYRGGVAPGVQLGSYAVAGCARGPNDEKLIQALGQGLKDGVTAVVFSMGTINGWLNQVLNLAFDEASRRGLLIAVAVSNDGSGGVFKTSRPASGSDGGEAVEFVWRDGDPGSGATGWNDMVLPLWFNLSLHDTGENCDRLFPDDVPDLSSHLVLLPRTLPYGSWCSDVDLAARVGEKGAVYVMMVDHDENERIEVVRVNTPSLHAIAMTDRKQGYEWMRLLQSGAEVRVNMTALPDRMRVLADKKQSGGRMSAFSEWGPTYDGYLPTSVSGPGDSLLTTKAGGGWVLSGGTSLSAPFVAAAAALVAEARGPKDWRVLRSLLSTTALPLVRAAPQGNWDLPGLELASTAQQGAGLVQAMNAIRAPCEISVHKILFNDTTNRQKAVFNIRNPTSDAITYDLGNIPAGTIRATVPGNGGQATIEVTASDPPGVNKTRLPIFSGWLALNGSDGFGYTIPYMGLAGSIDKTPTMHSLTWQRQDDSTIGPGGTVELPDGFPRLAFELALVARRVVTELRDAATRKTLGELPMYFGQMAYANAGWWGLAGYFDNGTRVPDGEYVAVAMSQAAFMSDQDRSKWQQRASPPLKIKWTR
ncbi:peptidase S8/S53 domain-containing protein [Apiospora aurea]|uniref:Peptidase S8/S53 domain-containing protein n=1 Tax=Apiospora aurea TaxID=335848 RepID=A0ABR1PUU2_9PEZI